MSRIKEERHDEKTRPGDGDTETAQGENQAPKARMPHEHDESADSQAAESSSARRIGEIAHDDVVQGQPDTDKGPVLDAAYERQKDGEKKKRLP